MISGYRLRLEGYYQARLVETGQPPIMDIQKQEVVEARFFGINELPANILPLQKTIIGLAKSTNLH